MAQPKSVVRCHDIRWGFENLLGGGSKANQRLSESNKGKQVGEYINFLRTNKTD